MIKRLLMVCILVLLASMLGACKGGKDMYVALYDRDLNHITNITDVKYSITKRVFDFDTSSFEGQVVLANVTNSFIFSLCTGSGNQIYSGFCKNIKQNNNKVSFKGEDLRKVYDTQIIMDYTNPRLDHYSYYLFDIFKDVSDAVKTQQTPGLAPLYFIYPQNTAGDPADWISTSWIANYSYQYLKVNALKHLKIYLAYYNYYIDARFDPVTKFIIYTYKDSSELGSTVIKLNDFEHQKTTTEVAVNKTIAAQKYNIIDQSAKTWIPTDVNYYNFVGEGKRSQTNGYNESVEEWFAPADNYEIGYALWLDIYHEGAGTFWYSSYYQVGNAATERPEGLAQKAYYLGSDNQIYEETIPTDKLLWPVNCKIFENEFFNAAQYDAITELINSRFNENIILSKGLSPIELATLDLYQMVTVYDKNGTSVVMPVSEIEISNDSYSVKLGFKKTLFTEVVKR